MLLVLFHLSAAESYALPGAGVTVNLPSGWQMTRYSDWDLNARTETGLALELRTTPWQVPLDAEAGKAWGTTYGEWLADSEAVGVSADASAPGRSGEREVLRTTLRFQLGGGGSRGVAHVAAFSADGKVVHVMVMAAAPNGVRASQALENALARITIDDPPSDLAGLGGTRPTPLGFEVTLPAGWRVPLESESEEVRGLTGATGASKPADCFTAVRPGPRATSLVLLCPQAWTLGVLDADSAADLGTQVRSLLFGKAAEAVPAPEALAVADRTALLYRPPLADYDLRLAVMPYVDGAVHLWAVSPKGTGDLDPVVRSILDSVRFEAGDGMPRYAMGQVVFHTLAYRPFHPFVLVSVATVLAFMGLVLRLLFRRPHPPRPAPY